MSGDRRKDLEPSSADPAEQVDLPPDLRREILRLHDRLGQADHWELLGLRWNAPAQAARAAYLEKVKVFHPDRYGDRRIGSFRARLEKIFRALTEARDVLADEGRRAAYVRKTAPPEEFARMEARRLEDEARGDERRARLARANPLVARVARVQELVRRGKQGMEEGDYARAANDFLTALGLDPRHPEARALAEQAKRRAAGARARELYERGLAAEAIGNRGAALDAFREAAEADPNNARFAAAASHAALEVGNLEAAKALAEQAVNAGPRDARAHEALGAVLQAQGLAKDARRALERAVELDPGLDTAKARLKKLRWSLLG